MKSRLRIGEPSSSVKTYSFYENNMLVFYKSSLLADLERLENGFNC